MSTSTHMDVDEPLDDIEAGNSEQEPLNQPRQPMPTRSLYALTRKEITRGIANRFVHSRTYIFLYLAMACLSITTVVLSIIQSCPGLPFYILEIIINATMIGEVSIRFVAFGRQFWRSPFNIIDLILTIFCVITVLVVVFTGCNTTSKEEEVFDTLLLVARNVLQFCRLAAVMRQSGHSIFSRPRPIDLSAARRAGFSLDLDLPDDVDEDFGRPRRPGAVLFDAQDERRQGVADEDQVQRPSVKVTQRADDDRDPEDVWASLG